MRRDKIEHFIRAIAVRKSALFAKYLIKSLAIFGSYARNEQDDESDLDVLVDFSEPVGIEFVDLANELEKILQVRVDLVSRGGIRPQYYEQIKDELQYI